MRIVGGSQRGRRLAAPAGGRIRPTGARVREALFDILTHGAAGNAVEGARVVDLFAGTGALGLEALSRGAAHLTAIERDPAALAALRANIAALAPAGTATVVAADATRPPPAPHACDLAFLDAPYRAGLAEPALRALVGGGWLTPAATVVVEHGIGDAIAPTAGLAVRDRRRYGGTGLAFLRPEP